MLLITQYATRNQWVLSGMWFGDGMMAEKKIQKLFQNKYDNCLELHIIAPVVGTSNHFTL